MSGLTISFMGSDVKLSEVCFTAGQEAKTNALPEDCYPAESAEIEFIIDTGCKAFDEFLNENFEHEIEGEALETAINLSNDSYDGC